MFAVKRYGQARNLSCSGNISNITNFKDAEFKDSNIQDLIDFIIFSDNNNSIKCIG